MLVLCLSSFNTGIQTSRHILEYLLSYSLSIPGSKCEVSSCRLSCNPSDWSCSLDWLLHPPIIGALLPWSSFQSLSGPCLSIDPCACSSQLLWCLTEASMLCWGRWLDGSLMGVVQDQDQLAFLLNHSGWVSSNSRWFRCAASCSGSAVSRSESHQSLVLSTFSYLNFFLGCLPLWWLILFMEVFIFCF